MTTAREKLDARRRVQARHLATLLIVLVLLTGATWAASWLATPGGASALAVCPEPTETDVPPTETDAPKLTETDKPRPTDTQVQPTETDVPATQTPVQPTETAVKLPTETQIHPTQTEELPTNTATVVRKFHDPTSTPFRGWPTKTPNAKVTPTPTAEVCDLCVEVKGIRKALEKLVEIFGK